MGTAGEPIAAVTLWGKPFDYTPADEVVCRLVVQQAHRLVERERFVHDLEDAGASWSSTLKGVARTLGAIVDTRDPYTAGHQHRVGELVAAIGGRLGLSEADITGLRIGGYLHDIGRIVTPFELLTQPEPARPGGAARHRTAQPHRQQPAAAGAVPVADRGR